MIDRDFQHLFKADLILLVNTTTHRLKQCDLEQALVCQLPSIDLTVRKYPFTNLEVRRYSSTWTINSTNYLHQQAKQLLGAC